MNWTTEMRYAPIDWHSINKKIQNLQENPGLWRFNYHIQPPYGLLNDPNGFCYFNGQYHLFFQWFPAGPVHGLKHWYHVTSTDLATWHYQGLALSPNDSFSSHGVYSGGGYVINDHLHLYYTGNHRDEDGQRHSVQAETLLTKEGQFIDNIQPLIRQQPEGYTSHFRDPIVWQSHQHYYMIVGAQRQDLTGTALIYQSTTGNNWHLLDELHTQLPHNFGYMWECPDYFELDHYGVFIFSPQGLSQYPNIYQSGYLIGNQLALPDTHFQHQNFQELDFGFDFYAPQTTNTPDGKRVLIAWLGLPELHYPTDNEGWAHCLTLPRELRVINNQLKQFPIASLTSLRQNQHRDQVTITDDNLSIEHHKQAYELEITIDHQHCQQAGIQFFANGQHCELILSVDQSQLIIDRHQSQTPINEQYGTTRHINWPHAITTCRIFVDHSSIEIFVGDGDAVATSRVFPLDNQSELRLYSHNGTAHFDYTIYDLQSFNTQND